MGSIRFPIIPYRRKAATTADQAEDAMARELFSRYAPPPPEPEVGPEPMNNRVGFTPILAESASLPDLPINRINVNQDAIDFGLSSADPRAFRAAQDMRTNFEESKPRGVWGKIGHHLAGMGRGVVEGLARGGAGGGIAGAVLGGISPRAITNLSNQREREERLPENVAGENLRYRQIQLERQRDAELRQQQNFERQQKATEAQIANIKTDNDRLAANDAHKREQEKGERERQAEQDALKRQEAVSKQQEEMGKAGAAPMPSLGRYWFDNKKAKDEIGFNQGITVTNVDPTKPGYRMMSTEQQDARKLQNVTAEARARGAAELEKRVKALPLELKEFADKERIKQSFSNESDKLDLQGVPTLTQFEAAKAEAKALATRASNARSAGDAATADKLQAQADEAYGKASAYHSAMLESGGYDDNSAGGWVGVKRKPQMKKGGVVAPKGAVKTSTSQIFPAAKVDAFAEKKFGGDKQKALDYLKSQGWTVQ